MKTLQKKGKKESNSFKIDIMKTKKIPAIDISRCVKCNACVEACVQKAITAKKNENSYQCQKCVKYCVLLDNVPCKSEEIHISYEKCNSCGKCIEVCKYSAIFWREES